MLNNKKFKYTVQDNTLYLKNTLVIHDIESFLKEVPGQLESDSRTTITIDFSNLEEIDSAGVTALNYLKEILEKNNVKVTFKNASESVQHKLDIFSYEKTGTDKTPEKESLFEWIGEGTLFFINEYLVKFFILSANVFVWSITDIFKRKFQRKGEFYNQAVLIGVNAIYIVATMSFIIGLVLALQSAAQLRNLGANIFIVDLTVIAMMREMGPLITAILVAGRSGSAIAAEIATMQVTAELDALKTMALHPVRFVVIPKLHGSLVTMPFLTVLANVFGILGGMFIAYYYLDISPGTFISRMEESLYNRDILIGVFKSLIYASLIVLTGSFFGLRVKQGAEGVGKVTTTAVVVAISLVIIADSIMGLFFY